MVFPVKRLADLGFDIYATAGTAEVRRRTGLKATVLRKHHEGPGPDGTPTTVQAIMAGEIDLIVNTPYGVGPRLDGYEIRTAAVVKGVPSITTVQGLAATVQGIESLLAGQIGVRSLQEHAADLAGLREAQDGADRW
jgi:carbamoyl-phosphate synthase large subunit